MQRLKTINECDHCHKKEETDGGIPKDWHKIFIFIDQKDDANDVTVDVCSSGCAEHALITVIRKLYEVYDVV